jgi:hypothetical protein
MNEEHVDALVSNLCMSVLTRIAGRLATQELLDEMAKLYDLPALATFNSIPNGESLFFTEEQMNALSQAVFNLVLYFIVDRYYME